MWAPALGSSAASGKFCDGTNASARRRGKPKRLRTGLPHFAHVPRLIAGGERWHQNLIVRLSGSATDSAQKYVTSANGLPYTLRQIVQWQKNRPIGLPWMLKREAPQRQAQSWLTIACRLARAMLSRRRPQPRKAAVEVGLQILDVLEPDAETHRRAAGRKARRGARGGAVEGKGEAFIAAPGIADSKQLKAVEERGDSGLRRRLQHDRKQARRAGIVALPKRMAWVVGQSGVDDAQDLWTAAQPFRQRQPLTLRLSEPELHGAQTAEGKEDVLGAGRNGHEMDALMKALEPCRIGRDEAEQKIGVAGEIFGAGLDRPVGA